MRKIMLVCSAGMSTSMLVKKMQDAAKNKGVDVEIFAVAEADARNHSDVDVVLLGPQVRFLLKKIQEMVASKGTPVAVIESVHYGTLNGDAVLTQALGMMK